MEYALLGFFTGLSLILALGAQKAKAVAQNTLQKVRSFSGY